MNRRFSIAALVCAVALSFAAPANGQADGEKPSPMDGTITAVKGQPITIELTSDAKTRASVVEFLIRDFPLSGNLGPMVSRGEDRTKVAVTYKALEDTAATSDTFTYAVRYPGGLWSRKGKVTIKLVASEAKIGATAEVDFGRVMIGQSETREIFLSNSGNATYRNQVRLLEPFSLVEPADGLLDLPIGGQKVVKVRFAPIAEGPVKFDLLFFRNDGASTVLTGTGYAPFSIAVNAIALRWEEKSRTRLGTVAVKGIVPKITAATVRSGDARLRAGAADGTLILKTGEVTEVPVYLPSEDVAAYEGSIEIAVGGYRLPVRVSAAVAPAYLVVENAGPSAGQRVMDFGSVKAGGVAQNSFQLRNAGGLPCKVNFTTGAPFSILAAGGSARLAPGESEAFALRVAAPAGSVGPYEGGLKIEADSGQTIPITLRAVFLADQAPPPVAMTPGSFGPANPNLAQPAPTPAGAQQVPRATPEEEAKIIEEMDRLRSPMGFVTRPAVERQIDPGVPSVAGGTMTLLEEGPQHLSVAWREPAGASGDFEIEMRVMRQADEKSPLESVWVPHHDVKYLPDGNGQMAADIRGLAPNRTYEFRLFTLGDNGKVSEPLPFVAKTPMPMDWTWIYISFGLLVLGGLGYLAWRIWGRGSISFGFPRSFRGLNGVFR